MKRTRMQVLVGIAAILLTPAFLFAVPITNSSFEAQSLANGALTRNDGAGVSGWETTAFSAGNGVGVLDPANWHYTSAIPDGENVAYLNGSSALWQDLDYEVAAGVTLTLSVEVGRRTNDSASIFTVELWGTTSWDEFLTTGTGSAFASGTTSVSAGSWGNLTYSVSDLDSLVGEQVTIVMRHLGGGTTQFDDLTLENHTTAAVPEPGTLLLLGVGLVGFGVARRKRNR